MTEYEKEYMEKLALIPNKKAIVTKEKGKYRTDVYKNDSINSCARFYTTSIEKTKRMLVSMGITTFRVRESYGK